MAQKIVTGLSHFRRGLNRSDRWNDFEKPDIMETLEALGVSDLQYHQSANGDYYNGPCPLHQAERNFTTFIVWPEIQKCVCKSCHPDYMDCIDIWMKIRNVKFPEAIKQICTPLSQEQALMKKLQVEDLNPVDLRFYAERLNSLFGRVDYDATLRAIISVNRAIERGQLGLADQILKRMEMQ